MLFSIIIWISWNVKFNFPALDSVHIGHGWPCIDINVFAIAMFWINSVFAFLSCFVLLMTTKTTTATATTVMTIWTDSYAGISTFTAQNYCRHQHSLSSSSLSSSAAGSRQSMWMKETRIKEYISFFILSWSHTFMCTWK